MLAWQLPTPSSAGTARARLGATRYANRHSLLNVRKYGSSNEIVYPVCGLEPAFDTREPVFNPDEPVCLVAEQVPRLRQSYCNAFCAVAFFAHGVTAGPSECSQSNLENSKVFRELIGK
jgi:hypothetical protein